MDIYNPIVIDFETYYKKGEYSLGKGKGSLTTEAYIRDPRFECIGLSVRMQNMPAQFYPLETWIEPLKQLIATYPDSPVVSHNANFDMGILGLRYGIFPKYYGDTVAMATITGLVRAAEYRSLKATTDKLIECGLIPPVHKGDTVHQMDGVHAYQMKDSDWAAYGDYCKTDTDLCFNMYMLLAKFIDPVELRMISATVAMFAHPSIELDKNLLAGYRAKLENERRSSLLNLAYKLGYDSENILQTALRSKETFANILRKFGVEPALKISPTTGKETYAFAKTDEFMMGLLEHPNETVRQIAETKIGVSSSIALSRTDSFLEIAERGLLPVPLVYAGAHTGRYAGTDKINCFSAGHELLTPDGWVAVENYKVGTPLCQYNPDDGGLSWCDNPNWIEKSYTGEMVSIDATKFKCRVTADHKILYYNVFKKSFEKRDAIELKRLSGLDNIPYFGMANWASDLPLTDNELRYLCALQADGSVSKKHTFGFRKARKIERLQSILMSIGASYKKADYTSGSVHFRVDPESLSPLVAEIGKGYGAWVLKLNTHQRQVLLDEIIHWDGNANSNSGNVEFNSMDKQQAQWVDLLHRLTGTGSSLYAYEKPKYGYYYRVYKKDSKFTSIAQNQVIVESVDNETVYCPRVDTGVVLFRYKDMVGIIPQCQNLPKRTGDKTLRRSLTAPDGYVIIATDSSQIECRALAYAANEVYLVDIFKNKLCPYTEMATDIFGMAYDEIYTLAKKQKTPEGVRMRDTGKETMLGCIAEGTEVLTDSGWKPIETLLDTDLLWDGESWVSHDGLINKGVKRCIEFNGVMLTPDHKVFDGEQWAEAQNADKVRAKIYGIGNLPDNLSSE